MDSSRFGSGEEVPSVSGILDDRLCPNPFSDAGGRWIGKITGGRTHASAGQIVWACHRHRADHRGHTRCDAMARRCGCGHVICQWRRGDEPARPTFPLRWAQRAEDRERNGDRELSPRIRLNCRSLRALAVYPATMRAHDGSEARPSSSPREQYGRVVNISDARARGRALS